MDALFEKCGHSRKCFFVYNFRNAAPEDLVDTPRYKIADRRPGFFISENIANMLGDPELEAGDRIQNRLAIAEGYYRSALEIDPNYGPALFGLGVVRQAFNSVQEAIDLYRKDVSVEPNNAAAHYNLGILLRVQGKVADGDAEIARAMQLDPKLPQPPAAPTPTPKPATPTPTR